VGRRRRAPAGAAGPGVQGESHTDQVERPAEEVAGAVADVTFQTPDRLLVTLAGNDKRYAAGRDGQRLWLHMPGERSRPRLARRAAVSSASPTSRATPRPCRRSLCGEPAPLSFLPLMVTATRLAPEEIDGERCEVLHLVPGPKTAAMLGIDTAQATLWFPRERQAARADRVHRRPRPRRAARLRRRLAERPARG
jgi:hypothetical protein